MEGGGQQTEPGPGQALIELATGQVRNFWDRQEGLRVKGSPGPGLPFLFQGGQSGEGARSLQPSVLSEEKKNRIGHPVYAPATPFPHPHTFWSGQQCGSSRISLCAFRLGKPGGARTSRAGARSCSPRLGLPRQEHCRNWWCLSTWGHSLGKGAESLSPKTLPLPGSRFPHRGGVLPPVPPQPRPSSSSLAGQLLQGLGNPQVQGKS